MVGVRNVSRSPDQAQLAREKTKKDRNQTYREQEVVLAWQEEML